MAPFFGRIVAVAFLPIVDASPGVGHVRAVAHQGVLAALDYFDSMYVSGAGDQNRRLPLSIYNIRGTAMNDGHRTNSIGEVRNNGFANFVGHKNPLIWKLIDKMRHDNVVSERVVSQHEMGQARRKRVKRALLEFQVRLGTLRAEYENGQRMLEAFLRAADRNVKPQSSQR